MSRRRRINVAEDAPSQFAGGVFYLHPCPTQPRTNADKRKAVITLLEDAEWSQWSDREIARRCQVSNTFVSNIRPSLSTNDSEKQQSTYTTKHGTTATMNTANIGKRQAEPADAAPHRPDPVNRPEPQSRGIGLEIAHQAIKLLYSIPRSDGLRDDAFQTVIEWIEANR